MIDIVTPRCPCGKSLTFGFEVDAKPSACAGCKKEGMIAIVNPKCPRGKYMHHGCEGDARPSACRNCASEGMIDIKARHCERYDVQAAFPNKQGVVLRLCGEYATEDGVIPKFNRGASKAAYRAMCAMATEGVAFEHEHVNPVTMKCEGKGVRTRGA